MGEVIQMPKRCAYQPCSKPIKAPQVNVRTPDGKAYHSYCYHEWLKVRKDMEDEVPQEAG